MWPWRRRSLLSSCGATVPKHIASEVQSRIRMQDTSLRSWLCYGTARARVCEEITGTGARAYLARRHVISTRTGISFLIGIVRNFGGSILKSVSVAGMVPDIRVSLPCDTR